MLEEGIYTFKLRDVEYRIFVDKHYCQTEMKIGGTWVFSEELSACHSAQSLYRQYQLGKVKKISKQER